MRARYRFVCLCVLQALVCCRLVCKQSRQMARSQARYCKSCRERYNYALVLYRVRTHLSGMPCTALLTSRLLRSSRAPTDQAPPSGFSPEVKHAVQM